MIDYDTLINDLESAYRALEKRHVISVRLDDENFQKLAELLKRMEPFLRGHGKEVSMSTAAEFCVYRFLGEIEENRRRNGSRS